MKAKIIAGAGWSGIEALSGQIISFAVFLILARLLTPVDFGLIALANIYVLIVQYFIFQGLGQAIIQFEDLDDEHLNTVFWINLFAAFFFIILTFVIAPTLGKVFGNPALPQILRALSPIFFLAALTDVQSNLLGRQLEFKSLALRTLLSYAIGGIVGVILALRGFAVWSFVGQQITVWVINFLTLWTVGSWRPRFVFSRSKAGKLIQFGVNLLGVDLMSLASKRTDQFVVGRTFGAQTLGFYSVGARVGWLMNEIIVKSLSRVTLSGLSRLQNDADRLLSAVYRIIELQMAIALPCSLGLAVLAGPVVQLFFGNKWLPGIPIMQVLLLAIPFEALSAIHFSALIALGKPKWCTGIMTAHALVNILFCLFAARFGVTAIALAVTLRIIILYPMEVWVVKKVIHFSFVRVFRLLVPIVVATLLMSAAIKYLASSIFNSGFFSLFSNIAIGVLVYTVFLAILTPTLFKELLHFKEMFRKTNPAQ